MNRELARLGTISKESERKIMDKTVNIERILEAVDLIRKFPNDEELKREQLYIIERSTKELRD